MTPYYDEDGITIYHGDARELLPLPSDAVVTDPPYGLGLYDTDRDVADVVGTLVHADRVAIFGYPKRLVGLCVATGWAPTDWVTWWPSNAAIKAFNLRGLAPEAECIAINGGRFGHLYEPKTSTSVRGDYTQGKVASHGDPHKRRLGDVWRDPSPGLGFNIRKRHHPNEKPLSLMIKLVSALSEPGETLLDPFMGSGTTLRAAKDLGRKAVGIEIEERYCEIAVQRLAQGVLAL